ncbi:MAG: cation:proton antiporter [Phycisphaerae bacterium]
MITLAAENLTHDPHAGSSMMTGLAYVILLGIGAQWLASRLRMPSILVLLVTGIIAGPVTHLIDPDRLFGGLLLPLVSLFVALILYEGGLSLRLSELSEHGAVVWALVTVGALVTWIGASLCAIFILGFSVGLAILLGAVLVVTGPTVIGPLLQHIRPKGPVSPILKWEGIVIDPIGALLAVLVFEFLITQQSGEGDSTYIIVMAITKTLFVAGGIGIAAAMLLTQVLRRYWVADHLQASVSLMMAIAAFISANAVQPESGLFAVTLMGIWVANQRATDIRHIVEFKENLRVLLIATLFILLSARLQRDDLLSLGWKTAAFAALLILIVRPISVFISTIGAKLNVKEKSFLAWMAPRGIVAAAVSSVFSLGLEEAGFANAEALIPNTFAIIIATVAVYGLTAMPLARKLGLTDEDPQGFLIVGAHGWARQIAKALMDRGFRVQLVDANRESVAAARLAGIPARQGNILDEKTLEHLELGGIGRLLAITPNDAVNEVAARRIAHNFGRKNVYQLVSGGKGKIAPVEDGEKRGRRLFHPESSYANLSARFANGAQIKTTQITEEFTYDDFIGRYGETALPLFLINKSGKLAVIALDDKIKPQTGQTLIALVDPASKGVTA